MRGTTPSYFFNNLLLGTGKYKHQHYQPRIALFCIKRDHYVVLDIVNLFLPVHQDPFRLGSVFLRGVQKVLAVQVNGISEVVLVVGLEEVGGGWRRQEEAGGDRRRLEEIGGDWRRQEETGGDTRRRRLEEIGGGGKVGIIFNSTGRAVIF